MQSSNVGARHCAATALVGAGGYITHPTSSCDSNRLRHRVFCLRHRSSPFRIRDHARLSFAIGERVILAAAVSIPPGVPLMNINGSFRARSCHRLQSAARLVTAPCLVALAMFSLPLLVLAQAQNLDRDPPLIGANGQPYLNPRRQRSDWRLTPTPVTPPSGTATDAARGKWAEARGQAPVDITSSTFVGTVLGGGKLVGTGREFPQLGTGAVALVGVFQRFQSILTASHRSVYTVERFSVERVVLGSAPPEDNGSVEVLQYGGTIQTQDGQTKIYAYLRSPYSLQPGHRYLLAGTFDPATQSLSPAMEWELRNGIALPVSISDNRRANAGSSRYAGLSEAKFIAKIQVDLGGGNNQ